ncbi:MAG: hypothetical protein IOC82_01960 [Aestuariivirga sp.]|uniref:hypothetical protein n=1 Tax=Aestuariivirga sp. TaxID=2650926 RepID=UPI0025BAF422|nr:hypothetical protein [Aestuariivirga sp.]MCA3559780.1 hypothetical protein [Aestuariivirga sp.]
MRAFIETTILVDLLLKRKSRRSAVKVALSKFSETLLPQYAIKEMKAGALFACVWLHNKLVTTDSIPDAIQAVHAMSRTPRRYLVSTALEAWAVAEESIASKSYLPNQVVTPAAREKLRRQEMINLIRSQIMLGWRRRRKSFTKVVSPLTCYVEDELILVGERIETGKIKCAHEPCCLKEQFFDKIEDTKTLMAECAKGDRAEDKKRYSALRHIARTPKREIDSDMCRSLGDAVFALQSPADATIVTTNMKDIAPLAGALGKDATRI